MNSWQVISGILQNILIMSISGSILTLILYILKPILNACIPKVAEYYLWMVVFVAFLVPFSAVLAAPINTPTAGIQNTINENVIANQQRYEKMAQEQFAVSFQNLDIELQNGIRSQGGNWWNDYLLLLPLIVFAVLLAVTLLKYLVFLQKLRCARFPAKKDEITLLEKISSKDRRPALYRNILVPTAILVGVFHPTIYLPDCNYSEEQLDTILRHELTHFRRCDVLIKWCSVLLTHLHWFNPLIYLARHELNRVCELSCDEITIKNFSDKEKQSYGDTLIHVAAGEKLPNFIISNAVCEEKMP